MGEVQPAHSPTRTQSNAPPPPPSIAPRQVYKLQDPYYDTNHGLDQDPYYTISQGVEDDDEEQDYDEDFEAPRPPPPAPTPASHPAGTGARRLRQTWGGATRGSKGRALDGVGAGGDPSALTGRGASVFVPPSKLQEASLWSTAMEQAALERRMGEVGKSCSTAVIVPGIHYVLSQQ